MNKFYPKKIKHLNYSKIGGAGKMARSLSQLITSNSIFESEVVTVIESNLKSNPFKDLKTTILSSLDNYIIKDSQFSGMYSHFRNNSNKLLLDSLKDFHGIIHLHWIHGLISLDKILELQKNNYKIVWTLHDLNLFQEAVIQMMIVILIFLMTAIIVQLLIFFFKIYQF